MQQFSEILFHISGAPSINKLVWIITKLVLHYRADSVNISDDGTKNKPGNLEH